MFNERTGTAFNAVWFPTDIVLMVVVWRLRYKLSLRDLVEMFAVRVYDCNHETVRDWEARFGPLLTKQLRAKRRGQAGKSWYVDETYVKVKGNWCYLYRAIDRDGNFLRNKNPDGCFRVFFAAHKRESSRVLNHFWCKGETEFGRFFM